MQLLVKARWEENKMGKLDLKKQDKIVEDEKPFSELSDKEKLKRYETEIDSIAALRKLAKKKSKEDREKGELDFYMTDEEQRKFMTDYDESQLKEAKREKTQAEEYIKEKTEEVAENKAVDKVAAKQKKKMKGKESSIKSISDLRKKAKELSEKEAD